MLALQKKKGRQKKKEVRTRNFRGQSELFFQTGIENFTMFFDSKDACNEAVEFLHGSYTIECDDNATNNDARKYSVITAPLTDAYKRHLENSLVKRREERAVCEQLLTRVHRQ